MFSKVGTFTVSPMNKCFLAKRNGYRFRKWTPRTVFESWTTLFTFYFTFMTICEFFTLVLANGLSLESEWQQVSSALQGSSKDSIRSLQCCDLSNLDFLSYIRFLQAFFLKLLGAFQNAPITISIANPQFFPIAYYYKNLVQRVCLFCLV